MWGPAQAVVRAGRVARVAGRQCTEGQVGWGSAAGKARVGKGWGPWSYKIKWQEGGRQVQHNGVLPRCNPTTHKEGTQRGTQGGGVQVGQACVCMPCHTGRQVSWQVGGIVSWEEKVGRKAHSKYAWGRHKGSAGKCRRVGGGGRVENMSRRQWVAQAGRAGEGRGREGFRACKAGGEGVGGVGWEGWWQVVTNGQGYR